MPDTPSIVLVKQFTYRGKPEKVSNKYHFSGTTPSNAAGWKALADAMIVREKAFLTPKTTFVNAYGYEAGNELSVAQIDYTVGGLTPAVGTYSAAGSESPMQPESAFTVRWNMGTRNSRKKWNYCRKYIHGSCVNTADTETIAVGARTVIQTWITGLTDGTLPGGAKYCGPQGEVLAAGELNQYATTRELKRRGKRPSS